MKVLDKHSKRLQVWVIKKSASHEALFFIAVLTYDIGI